MNFEVSTFSAVRHNALQYILDKRTPRQQLIDQILSLFREAFSHLRNAFDRRTRVPFTYHKCDEIPAWKPNSEGLFVFLHGFNGHPSTWMSHLGYLQSRAPRTDVLVPHIPKAGDCPLECAAQPLLKPILDYIQKNPTKPLCLVGFSNGSRIATWLEVKLRTLAPGIPIRVSTIAGVHLGTPLIGLLEKAGLAKWFCSNIVREELRHLSHKTMELWAKVREPLPLGTRRFYDFWASSEDTFVGADLSSALPLSGSSNARFHLVHGYGHTSLVPAVAAQQLYNCLSWTREINGAPAATR